MGNPRYILLYDRDCGICSALSRWVRAFDWRGRIRLESIQSSRSILVGIPEDRMLDAFHIVSPDGHVSTGGDAVPTLIGAFPIGSGAERVLRGSASLMGIVHRFYGFLTRFRDRLVCRLEPAGTSAGSGL
jgi:predicted DCC family thiol-disulfide oxidoreductase YuxK